MGGFRSNPLVLVGTGSLLGIAFGGGLADASRAALLAQSTLPAAVAIGVIAYGVSDRTAFDATDRRTVLRWASYGVGVFAVAGGWFGFLSRTVATSFWFAIVASLASGAAVGALVGVYAARLRRSNEQLAAKTDRLETFASVVSHDLRSPLNIASGRVQMARDRHGDDEDLRTAADALDRMDELIVDLLALARTGEAIDDREPVDLAAVAANAWTTVDTPGATLDVGTDRVVMADRGRLRQAFENLFRNAIEHGRRGPHSGGAPGAVGDHRQEQAAADGGTTDPTATDRGDENRTTDSPAVDGQNGERTTDSPAVDGQHDERTTDELTIRVADLDDGFYVADDGVGIPPEERDVVFELGHSTDADGSGLGLHIVERIVEAHGWSIDATESVDRGARFEITGAEGIESTRHRG